MGVGAPLRTEEVPGIPIENGMENAVQATGIIDGLLEPNHVFLIAAFFIVGSRFVFLRSAFLVRWRSREDEDES